MLTLHENRLTTDVICVTVQVRNVCVTTYTALRKASVICSFSSRGEAWWKNRFHFEQLLILILMIQPARVSLTHVTANGSRPNPTCWKSIETINLMFCAGNIRRFPKQADPRQERWAGWDSVFAILTQQGVEVQVWVGDTVCDSRILHERVDSVQGSNPDCVHHRLKPPEPKRLIRII